MFTIAETSQWHFGDYFEPIGRSLRGGDSSGAIAAGRQILAQAGIAAHPFFSYARSHRSALIIWTAQESVITNHFSQVLFLMMSKIKNVHIRSLLAPVVTGEHSALKDGVAFGSHPHLLSKLVADLEMDPGSIKPLSFTVEFAETLTESTSSIQRALGVLGVGNESMLVPEYTAVETAFAAHFPRDFYRAFLRANIEEDKSHSNLMEQAAACLIRNDGDADKYVSGARDGVGARIKYYDELLSFCERTAHVAA